MGKIKKLIGVGSFVTAKFIGDFSLKDSNLVARTQTVLGCASNTPFARNEGK